MEWTVVTLEILFLTTCKEPTITVDEAKAQNTPKARAYPKVANGGKGEMTLARNAATVVTTASESGTDNRAQDLNHASAGSSTSLLIAEKAR
jgi:hypothetical protein